MLGIGVLIDDFIEKLFCIVIEWYILIDKGKIFCYVYNCLKDIYS